MRELVHIHILIYSWLICGIIPLPLPVKVLNAPPGTYLGGFAKLDLVIAEDDSAEDDAVATYVYSPATACFTCRTSPPPSGLPRHISSTVSEEGLLRDRGWGFLDDDSSEPATAFNVDEYNKDMEYTPEKTSISPALLEG